MITYILIKLLHLGPWFYLGLIAEYFIGSSLTVAAVALISLEMFKLADSYKWIVLLRKIITAPVTLFVLLIETFARDGITGKDTWLGLGVILACFISPVGVIVTFFVSLVLWILKKRKRRR